MVYQCRCGVAGVLAARGSRRVRVARRLRMFALLCGEAVPIPTHHNCACVFRCVPSAGRWASPARSFGGRLARRPRCGRGEWLRRRLVVCTVSTEGFDDGGDGGTPVITG